MIRQIAWLMSLTLTIMFTITIGLGWLLGTDPGTKWLLAQLQSKLPVLKVEGISGNFNNGLRIETLTIYAQQDVELTQVQLDINFWPLLRSKQLEISHLAATTIALSSPEPTPAGAQSATSKLPQAPLSSTDLWQKLPKLPVSVEITEMNINELNFADTTVKNLSATSRWTSSGITLTLAQLQIADAYLAAKIQLNDPRQNGATPTPFTLNINWAAGQDSGVLQAYGTFEQPNIKHRWLSHSFGKITSDGQLDLSAYPLFSFMASHHLVQRGLTLETTGGQQKTQWEVNANITQGPDFEAQMTGQGVQDVQGYFRIADLAALDPRARGGLDADFSWQAGRILANISSERLSFESTAIDTPRLALAGTPEALNFQASWSAGFLSGALENFQTQPILILHPDSQLSIEAYTISPDRQVRLAALTSGWQISAHCWIGLGRLCVDQQKINLGEIDLTGTLSDVELNTLNPYLPATLSSTGTANGNWQVIYKPDTWLVDLNLFTQGFALDQDIIPAGTVPEINLNLTLDPSGAHIQAQGTSSELSWYADVSTQGLSPDLSLKGDLRLSAEAALAEPFVTQIESIEGNLSALGTISGSLAQPQFSINGSWTNGHLTATQPSLELKAIDAHWTATGTEWALTGSAQVASGGEFSLSGKGNGYDTTSALSADLQASSLQLDSEEWKITADPEISMELSNGQISLMGMTQIPSALVTIKTLPPNIPRPEPDVRLRDRPRIIERESDNGINGQIEVVLGDDVRLELMALKVRLSGAVVATISGGQITAIHGTLTVAEGSLEANGIKLDIQQGDIIFSGNPQIPFIDVIAARTLRSQSTPLRVGLRVTGIADQLNTQVYSDPPMNNLRALSYLALGRDFKESSARDNQQLMLAALSLGLSQSNGVIKQIRSRLGLDELSALSAEQNEFAIIAGKRINQDLYVRYSYNALSAVGALIIRYYLNERWRVEATNDINHSMDLLYEFAP